MGKKKKGRKMVEDRLSSVSALSHEVAWKKKKKKGEENGRGPFEQWVCSEPRGGAIESNKKKTKQNKRKRSRTDEQGVWSVRGNRRR